VSADLRLGQDLRRPEGIEALTLVTSAASPPYLRMATLSRFDGDVWRPDRGERVPLREGFGERDWAESIKTVETDVSIKVLGVSSDRLPLPYAPERVSGVNGVWSALQENRTAVSGSSDAAGADYTVQAATPVPTLEQIRASSASGADVTELPADLPPIINRLAREVTSDADTDYDRLIALQDWFRNEFTYSLDAPVEEGFDGTGADAVATFLEKRTGYCIHFAGAFALMADTLGMPVRIVVGYLPGSGTDQRRDDSIVYSVTSDQLHSWPEVHFEGIGWVPFEPTATLGVPTDFIAASSGGSGDGPEAPTPTIAPTTSPSATPTDEADRDQDVAGGGTGALQTLNPAPVTLTVLGLLVLLLLPAMVRELRRAMRMGRARSGDAMAAWRELSDTLIDLGLAAPEAQTARVRAEVLVTRRGTDPEALAPLVAAVERVSYAPSAPDAGDLAAPLRVVIAQLAAGVDSRQRLLTRLLPASLFVRRR
jgi:transglutaminase-like putative cysteine protease